MLNVTPAPSAPLAASLAGRRGAALQAAAAARHGAGEASRRPVAPCRAEQGKGSLFSWSETKDEAPSKGGAAGRASRTKENDLSLSSWMFNDSSKPAGAASRSAGSVSGERQRPAGGRGAKAGGERTSRAAVGTSVALSQTSSGASSRTSGSGGSPAGSSRRSAPAPAADVTQPPAVTAETMAEIDMLSRLLGKSRLQLMNEATAAPDREDDDDDLDDAPAVWQQQQQQQAEAQRQGASAAKSNGKAGSNAARAAPAAAASPALNRIGDTQLHPWQLEVLQKAYAVGKRKVSIQAVAADAALDRSQVIAWFKLFEAQPDDVRSAAAERFRPDVDAARAAAAAEKQAKVAAAQAAAASSSIAHWLDDGAGAGAGPTATSARDWYASGGRVAAGSDAQGFLPFHDRKMAGLDRKKMRSEVLRTLESVYQRSAYPAAATVKSLHDLHRLPRDAVLDWFAHRRELDGLAPAGSAAAAASKKDDWAFVRNGAPARPEPAGDSDHAELIRLMSQQAAEQRAGGEGEGAAPDGGVPGSRTMRLTRKEMAALRSSLPSPSKRLGMKLAEQLNIKQADDGNAIDIAGLQFVANDGSAAWRRVWRRRRAQQPAPGKQLNFLPWYNNAVAKAEDGPSDH